MNPPPFPNEPPPLPQSSGKSFAHQAASCSLVAPLIMVLMGIVLRAAASQSGQMPRAVSIVLGLVCFLFIVAGLVAGIVGLCGVKKHGASGILGRSIAGLIINALLLFLFAIGFASGVSRGLKSKQAARDLTSASREFQTAIKNEYDPKRGITNMDIQNFDRLRSQIDSAGQQMSGDDAAVTQIMSAFVGAIEAAMKNYQKALTDLRAANVLSGENLQNPAQIDSRRQIVENFLAANRNIENLISNADKNLRSELANRQISPSKIDVVMAGYDSKAIPRNALVLEIRSYDDTVGQSMLTMLDLLKENWGKWNYDPATKLIYFQDDETRRTYNDSLAAIRLAGKEQIKAQGELVNLK